MKKLLFTVGAKKEFLSGIASLNPKLRFFMFTRRAVKGMQKTKGLFQVELFLLIALFSPILIIQRPIWDGVLVKFGEQNNFSYLNSAALDYSFPLLYAPEMILSSISRLTNINFFIFYYLALILVLLVLLRSILKISKLLGMKQPSNDNRLRIAILYVFFTPFHTLYSTQNFIFIICILFCLEGLVNINSSSLRKKLTGILLILFSFQMPSMPFLGFALYLGIIHVRGNLKLIGIIKFSIAPAIFCATYLILVREVFFPSSGLYADYNKVVINLSRVSPAMYNLSNFIFLLLPLAILVFLTIGNWTPLDVKRINAMNGVKPSQKNQLLFILTLTGFSIFPYVLANKSPYKLDLFDWSYRHALPLVVPITLLSIWIANFEYGHSKKPKRVVPSWTSVLAIFLLAALTFSGAYGHVQSMLMDKKLVSKLNDAGLAKLDEGVVCVNYLNPRLNDPRFYELNALAWETTGLVNWQLYGDQNCQEITAPREIFYGSSISKDLNKYEWKNQFIAGTNSDSWTKIDLNAELPLDFFFRHLKEFLR